MAPAATLEIKGIKCDHCDWSDMEIEFDPDFWLNKPCPECGENLFTPEDNALIEAMSVAFKVVNELVDDGVIKVEPDEELVEIEFKLDGTGNFNIEHDSFKGFEKE